MFIFACNLQILFQILSRVKSDSANSRQSGSGNVGNKGGVPAFDEFLLKRDYTGVRTLLEVNTFSIRFFIDSNDSNAMFTVQCECRETRNTRQAMDGILQFSFGQL